MDWQLIFLQVFYRKIYGFFYSVKERIFNAKGNKVDVAVFHIGVGRFRILGGPRFRILGGGARFRILEGARFRILGGQIPSRHMTS